MEAVKVVIQSLEDARNGKALVEGLTAENSVQYKDFTVGILEGGTMSGQTTLCFVLKGEDGQHHWGEMTAKHFEALHGIFQAAQARFKK